MATQQRIWFITGVSGGLGRSLAQQVALAGDIAIGTLRKPEQLADFNNISPGKTFGILMDVNNHIQVTDAVVHVLKQYSRIDVLVNNAGYGLFGAIEEISMEEARAQMETNFFGVLQVTQAVLPAMRKQGSGHILQISSVAGFRATAGLGIYNASKFALEGFSEALSLELSPLNINVTLVEPGPFRTEWAGSSSIRAKNVIADYEPTAGARIKLVNSYNGKQDGDPVKAAQAMIKVVNTKNPPLRLPLGPWALEAIRNKISHVQQNINDWESVSLNTSFEQR